MGCCYVNERPSIADGLHAIGVGWQRANSVLVKERTHLTIYLQDHLAGSVGGLKLAERCLANNPDGELGNALRWLVQQIKEDKKTLAQLMRKAGVKRSVAKQGAAWLAEKLGRLKLNGRLNGYSDLSRLVELEGLYIGISGKRALWSALNEISARHPQWESFDFATLIERAQQQRSKVDMFRVAAAQKALLNSH